MIRHPAFVVEPWAVRETELDVRALAQTESVFALGNGHIGLRGNLDEGEPYGLPGTYLNGLFEFRPLPYAEAGYGNPESGQTVVNITNGKLIRLLVEDEPLDIRYGEVRSHERVLDLREGTLRRTVEWTSPTGRSVRIRSTRLVSFSQRAVAAIRYEVEALDRPTRVVADSALVANEQLPGAGDDPRAGALLGTSLHSEMFANNEAGLVLVHSTASSGRRVAAAIDHAIDGPPDTTTTSESYPDLGRVLVAAEVAPGQGLRITKFLAYGWSRERSAAALRDQVRSALAEARRTGWDGLVADQRQYLDAFWERADVEIEGDPELQQAVRFGLYHVLQAAARAEGRAIPAKGLTGPGYDGHAFWDTEMFVLPLLSYTAPEGARDALRWRYATLERARDRAASLGLAGAAFPWRTIHGEECSGYWPAGTAAFHVSAAIADAVVRYEAVSDDQEFAAGPGLELLVATARLWRSLGHHDIAGAFRIDGVTGPDEYSAIADNNVYTNLMAQKNLRAAFDACQRFGAEAAKLGVDREEAAAWQDAADRMVIPYDEQLGIHPQAESFTDHQAWPFESTPTDKYPLLLHFPYFDLYRKQVIKQADLVLALHVRGDAFTDEQKARDFTYYERLTVRDSSLSASTQAVVAAEVGHLELAYDYLGEAALIDLDDLEHNTRDGLHMASLAGAWSGAVRGFGGLRDNDGTLSFAPRLPQGLSRLTFRLSYRGSLLRVEVVHARATYTVLDGGPLALVHHGKPSTVEPGKPLTAPIPRPPKREEPTQPVGRAPVRRAAVMRRLRDSAGEDPDPPPQ
jgi:alpha,alpha-trehalose phosphorylase